MFKEKLRENYFCLKGPNNDVEKVFLRLELLFFESLPSSEIGLEENRKEDVV